LTPGDIFGEAYVLDGTPTTSSLRAAEDSIVISIARMTLNSMIKESPDFSRNYIKYLGDRHRQAMEKEENLLELLLSAGLNIPEL